MEPPKIEQFDFVTFPKYFWATKRYVYCWYNRDAFQTFISTRIS